MITALNVLPSKQKPIPDSVPTEGPCPVWSAPTHATLAEGAAAADAALQAENARLQQRVTELEASIAAGSC